MSGTALVVVLVFVLIALFIGEHFETPSNKRKRLEREKRNQEESDEARKGADLWYLKRRVNDTFGIELDEIHNQINLNEVVRIVNLFAVQVAQICVEQDKALRTSPCHSYDWITTKVGSNKRSWSTARDLAIQICPELKDRLPHFSEFEPLKSYREEHLRDKAEKAARRQAS